MVNRARLLAPLLILGAWTSAAAEPPLVVVLDEQAAELADKIAGAFKPETSSPTVTLAEARLVGVSSASVPVVRAFEELLAARLSARPGFRLVESSSSERVLVPTVVGLGDSFLVSAHLSGRDADRSVSIVAQEVRTRGRRKAAVAAPAVEASTGAPKAPFLERQQAQDRRFHVALRGGSLRQAHGSSGDVGVGVFLGALPVDVMWERVAFNQDRTALAEVGALNFATARYRFSTTVDRIKAAYRLPPFPVGRRRLYARVGTGLALILSRAEVSINHPGSTPVSGTEIVYTTRALVEAGLSYEVIDRLEAHVSYEKTLGATVMTPSATDYGIDGLALKLSYRIW